MIERDYLLDIKNTASLIERDYRLNFNENRHLDDQAEDLRGKGKRDKVMRFNENFRRKD